MAMTHQNAKGTAHKGAAAAASKTAGATDAHAKQMDKTSTQSGPTSAHDEQKQKAGC